MKLLVLYRPNSEFASATEAWVRELQSRGGTTQLDVRDYDSQDGQSAARAYNILAQPALVVTQDDGSYIHDWQGSNLPLIDEVAGYLRR